MAQTGWAAGWQRRGRVLGVELMVQRGGSLCGHATSNGHWLPLAAHCCLACSPRPSSFSVWLPTFWPAASTWRPAAEPARLAASPTFFALLQGRGVGGSRWAIRSGAGQSRPQQV